MLFNRNTGAVLTFIPGDSHLFLLSSSETLDSGKEVTHVQKAQLGHFLRPTQGRHTIT